MYIKNPEYFLTVARERGISKAAEKLLLSQPYLSQCIGRMEQELGMKLFDRSHTPLTLTEAGKLYLSYLEGVGALTGKFESQLEELKTDSRQTLNIGMTLWRGSVLLPDILPVFTELHPEARIVLHEEHSEKLEELLLEEEIDFALMNIPKKVDEFIYELILNERMLLVANREAPFVRGLKTSVEHPAHISLDNLKGERFLLLPEWQVMGRAMANLFSKMGIQCADILYTTSSTTAVNLVSGGFGITFLPEGGIRHVSHRDRLAFFTVDNPPFSIPLLILYKKNTFVTPLAKEFIDMTRVYYAGLVKGR